MSYAIPTLKVVSGAVLGYLMYVLAADTNFFSVFLVSGSLFVVGLFLTIHGLFTGIEAAVAAGNGRTDVSD